MNRGNGVITYILMLSVFLLALLLGAVYFITGMHTSSYMVSDGVGYALRYLDKPRYDRHLFGLIYSVAFFLAGLLLLFVVGMPDERMMAALRRPPPQPRRRRPAPPREEPAAVPPVTPAAPVREAAPAAPEAPTVTVAAPGPEAPAVPAAPAPPPPPKPEIPVDLAAQQEVPEMPVTDLPSARAEPTGEEDVVYGNGPVTEDSIVEFIQNYPDSAVKFLYRKNLDNRPLPPVEEDIYQRWERRGMSRAKVRGFVLEIMGWEKLPDDFPHNIWLKLRDRIYELKSEMKSR
jgi:hypothetical protein